jgi:pilus assembly protein CpaE
LGEPIKDCRTPTFMNINRPFTIELIGDERRRHEVKAGLLAIEDPQVTVLDPAPGIPSGESLAASVDATIAMVGANGDGELFRLRARPERKDIPLFALLCERSAAAMRRALQEGADELLFMPLDKGYITRALLNASENGHRANQPQRGVVCSLVSNTGGVGVTTLTANIGLALQNKLHRRVAFLDLHLQAAGLAVLLDLSPQNTITALGQTHRKLDSAALSSVMTKHASDSYLLSAPSGIEESELVTEETVVTVLQLMSQLFDFVLVDCGSYIDAKTVAVWERSDHLLYVLDQSIIAARSAGRFLDLLTRLDRPHIEPKFVLNKYVHDYTIGEAQLVDALKRPIFVRLPRDNDAVDKVQLTGADLWQVAPQSALTHDIVTLAGRLAGEPEDHSVEVPEGLVSRFIPRTWRSALAASRC